MSTPTLIWNMIIGTAMMSTFNRVMAHMIPPVNLMPIFTAMCRQLTRTGIGPMCIMGMPTVKDFGQLFPL